MNNFNYNCGCSRTHGAGVVPGPCIVQNGQVWKDGIRLKTEVLPVSAGTDAPGQIFAPKFARWFNTVVKYQANGALYIYDSCGVFTEIMDAQARREIASAVSKDYMEQYVAEAIAGKQDILVSGQNIKTINHQSMLGEGNLAIDGGEPLTVNQFNYLWEIA